MSDGHFIVKTYHKGAVQKLQVLEVFLRLSCDVVIKNVLPCTFLIGEFGKAETSLLCRTTAIRGGADSHCTIKT